MIDYYYEFPEGTKIFDESMRYAIQRGYHPEESLFSQRHIHQQAYQYATRIWLENANGLTLIRERGRDTHQRCHPREMTWIKLQAKEL